ncbi:MAG: bifunctional metallophosphatase/5'-nucleotidase [Bdellovibrionales bacterium]|nr:bifunctional metallophosphatase/5'-nucleotidase [Bdellovibrionales bacterium]
MSKRAHSLVFTLTYAIFAAIPAATAAPYAAPVKLSFLMTNDVHGHLEPNGSIGGLSTLATIVHTIAGQAEYQNGRAGFFTIDSGDQFQGTLISNYDEGSAVFKAFNEIGYDAIIPGNHDYDFGPINWLYDRVTPGQTGNNPREVIEGLSAIAKFPMLSANTYIKKTIKSTVAGELTLDNSCVPTNQTLRDKLDFSTAERPAFLKPYVIVEKAGVRVALIGIDNKNTTAMTTGENVGDLCFRDEAETYIELRKQLEGQADVFVILMHNGDTKSTEKATLGVKDGSDIGSKILDAIPDGVDLIAAGHTHYTHNNQVNGVRVIQDGAEARAFGRVDLFFDPINKKVLRNMTRSWAGQEIDPGKCAIEKADRNAFICDQYPVLPVAKNAVVEDIIASLKNQIAPLAKKKILTANVKLTRNRIGESPLTNVLTDAFRRATKTEISFMNTGGIRVDLPAGDILYEKYFEVLPFNNQAVIINALRWDMVKTLLIKSIQTCGKYGSLLFSGLRIEFTRTCTPTSDMDMNAQLVKVTTDSGEVLMDGRFEVAADRTFKIATLDFIADGGNGYEVFRGVKQDGRPGIARELIADQLSSEHFVAEGAVDGRMKNIAPTVQSTIRAIGNPRNRAGN